MAAEEPFDVVTGAFGYTGKYIARLLLAKSRRVRTLTRRPQSASPFGREVRAVPLDFNDPGRLTAALQGARTLYNTYWIRFPRGQATFEQAVANSRVLLRCARQAGIRRFVHVSISNASADSSLPYFRGKGMVEQAIEDSGLTYAIVRPTVVFGLEDILINNIAWLLRKLPFFGIPGSGQYRLQPVLVDDLAELAVRVGSSRENVTIDAAGPEIFTFEELVRMIAERIGSRAYVKHMPQRFALVVAGIVGRLMRDVVLTADELEGLMADLLVSTGPPSCSTRFGDWLAENARNLGRRYSSELARHYR